LAGGDRLYVFDARTGTLVARWPDAVSPEPRGIGRGLLARGPTSAGGKVLWPTQEELRVFDLAASLRDRAWRMARPPINLARHSARGGNVLAANGMLLIATSQELVAWKIDEMRDKSRPER
ncbi:MAG: hypothetical protein WD176_09105, partial [Pirellulales bacterium]